MTTRFAAVLLTYGDEQSPSSIDGTSLCADQAADLIHEGSRVHVADGDAARGVMRALGFTPELD